MPDELRKVGSMKELRTMTLKVELLAGTSISDAAEDLCELADRVGVMIEARFNGVMLLARPGDDWRKLVHQYDCRCRPAEYRTDMGASA